VDGDQRSPQRLERGIRGLKGVADSAGQCSVEIHFRYTSKTVRAVSQAVVYLAYLFHSTIAPEQDQSVSQPLLWLEGLLLISKHIQEAFSHRNRAKSTQLLGLVCGLRHTYVACIFEKPVSSLDATCQPCLWLEKLAFGIRSVCSLAAFPQSV